VDTGAAQKLAQAFDRANEIREALSLGEWTHDWSRSSCSGQTISGTLQTGQLKSLAALGCRVSVRLDTERLHVTAMADRSPIFAIDADGEFADVAHDPSAATAAAEAAAGRNLQRLFEVLADLEVEIELTVLGVEGLAWTANSQTLIDLYGHSGWLAFAALVRPAVDTGRLVILDAEKDEVRCPGWVIHGPNSWPEKSQLPTMQTLTTGSETDFRVDYPAPSTLLPLHVSDPLLAVADVLRSTAAPLALLGLADSAHKRDGDVSATFHGNRPLVVEVTPAPPESASPCVDLWEWVAEGSHPGRRHAAVQAITMQVETADDFYRRAGVIRDTSQFLFAVSQSGLVQEAIAARRGARDSAISAARSAAERARSSARAAVDRALVVMGAGVGIVLANRGGLIDRPVAVALLVLASVLVVGAGVLAFLFELPGAAGALKSFRDDLEHQTEVLTRRDVEQIGDLPSLLDAQRDIKRAKRAVWAIVSLAAVALAILFVVLFSNVGDGNDGGPPPTTVTSTTQNP